MFVALDFAGDFGLLRFDFLAIFLLAQDGALAHFRHRAPGADDVALQLGNGAAGVGDLALQFEQAVARHIAFFDDAAGVAQLFVEQRQLAAPVYQHAFVRLQQPGLALGAFFNRLQIGAQGGAARLQQLFLIRHLLLDQRIAGGGEQVGVKADLAVSGLLGLQTALHGAHA